MKRELTRKQLIERAQLKAKNLAGAISQSAFANCRGELEEELQFLQCALACMEDEPVEPIWGTKKYPVSRPVPGSRLIVWDETGKFVGYGHAVNTRESGVAIQMSDGRRFDSNHDLRWQYALQPLPVVGSESVAKKVTCWSCRNEVEISAIGDCDGRCPKCDTPIHLDEEPYTAPQPAPDREQVRREHAEWSQTTFGNVGPVGPLKHLSKEALEAAAEPDDLSEWADMQFLLWDAQRRAGITDEQITLAMIEKLAVNKLREWPAPKDGEPRLHIKEQPAPVAEREPIAWLNDAYLARGVVDGEAGSEDAGPGYIPVYREAGPQPVPVELRNHFRAEGLAEVLKDAREYAPLTATQWETLAKNWHQTFVGLSGEESACRAAMLQTQSVCTCPSGDGSLLWPCPSHSGNSPVIPDGYVMVPKEPTPEILAVISEAIRAMRGSAATYARVLAAAPQEVKGE